MRHNVLPGEYLGYELWQPDRKVNIDNYLYAKEGMRVFNMLNRPSQPNPIDDKLAFYEMCKAHAIPSPEILAAFTPAGMLLEFESGRPPERDLFVKTRSSLGGDGAERFRWDGVAFESSRGGRLRLEDISTYLATRARTENRTLLIQPALANHPNLRLGANADLAPARVVTGLSTDGKVIAIYGHFYYPADQVPSRQGQVHQIPVRQGRVALIDVASGRIMPVLPPNSSGDTIQAESGSDDCIFPNWDVALRYANAAHHVCSNFAFIGWDIAFTDQGPKILEGNANWSAGDYQRLCGQPLGRTEFAEILATQLRDLALNATSSVRIPN
jgi:hypothetical protein